jgi:uncharacterized protein (DUF1800 family)
MDSFTSEYLDAAHLLRRAGFGAAPKTIRVAAQSGLAETTEALLYPERTPDHFDDAAFVRRLAAQLPSQVKGRLGTQVIKLWWVHRMLMTRNPLLEKMTLFWHRHFTSNLPNHGDDMFAQNQLFRAHALGNFRTLALAVSRDPAMLRYLNGSENYKAHPNENYARELMEIYTTGIGHYTEDDVKASARAFSGWNLAGADFHFDPLQHDNGPKTFLGRTGNWNGDDIVSILVAHPATARRLCTQLFAYLAYPDPEPSIVEALVRTYYAGGYEVRPIVRQILTSPAFYGPTARGAIIKSPVQFTIGTIKMLGVELAFEMPLALREPTPTMDAAAVDAPAQRDTPLDLLNSAVLAMHSMGQDIFAPPTVKGWDDGEAWINATTLMNRVAFGNRLAQARPLYSPIQSYVHDYAARTPVPLATAWVDCLTTTLGPLQIDPRARALLVAYASSRPAPEIHVASTADSPPRSLDAKEGHLLGLLPLLMGTPQYQVC